MHRTFWLTACTSSLQAYHSYAALPHFCRLFKQSIGVAPHQYIMQQRVERAKRLLQDQTVPLADITTACGFVDQSHFTKYFRQLTGSTPKVYRIQYLCMAS